MRKKMKLPFLFKTVAVDSRSSSSSWPWPSCNQPRTLSFRAADMFKTMNSAYLDGPSETQTPESWFSRSSDSAASPSTASDGGDDPTEAVIRGAKSERLFFEPGETNSILEEVKVGEPAPLKESLVVSLESRDPYGDFRGSMAEMVEAHGLRGWDKLEELLGWYLRVNCEQNHDYILGAFIDLLVALASPTPTPLPHNCASSSSPISKNLRLCHQGSPSSPLSFYTSFSSSSSTTPCASSSLDHDDHNDHHVKEIQEIEQEENPWHPPGTKGASPGPPFDQRSHIADKQT